MERGDSEDLREELAEDDDAGVEDDRWKGECSPGCPAPFAAMQYPVLQKRAGTSTWLEAAASLGGNCLGVGVLALPRVLARSGLFTGLLALGLSAAVSRETLLLLLRLGSSTPGASAASYPEVGRRALGPQGLAAVLAAYLAYSGGLVVACLVALSGLLQPLVSGVTGVTAPPRALLVCGALLLCAPGVLLRSLRRSLVLSGLCLAGAAVMALSVLLASLGDLLAPDSPGVPADLVFGSLSPKGLLAVCSVSMVQFALHGGVLEVLQTSSQQNDIEDTDSSVSNLRRAEMWQPSLDVQSITQQAVLAAGLLAGAAGAAGYMRFGNTVSSNVIESFAVAARHDSAALLRRTLLNIATTVYAATLVVACAFAAVPCRAAALELLASRRSGGVTTRAFYRVSVGILATCGLLAGALQELDTVLELVGALAAGPLVMILPALFALELARRQDGRPVLSPENMRTLALLAFGLCLFLGCVVELLSWILQRPAGHRGDRVLVHDLTNLTFHLH